MSEPKWTAGPWEVAYRDGNGQIIVRGEIEVCTCWHHCVGSIEKQMEANANLIAAAPELYEALADLMDTVKQLCLPIGGTDKQRRALKKARGEA